MRCITILLIQLSLLGTLFFSCDKEQEKPENCNPINFAAEAEGDGLAYEWTKTLGVINGSGYSVTYVATPCAIGEIEVTCKVIDICGNSESMTITIQVI